MLNFKSVGFVLRLFMLSKEKEEEEKEESEDLIASLAFSYTRLTNIALALRGHSLKGTLLLRGPIRHTSFSMGTKSLFMHFLF